MMENEVDVLRDVSRRLESAGIAFMLTGSLAMTHYARPRMTRDIDLVISLDEAASKTLVHLFEQDYYIDPGAVSRAIGRHSMFNLIHNATTIKSIASCSSRMDIASKNSSDVDELRLRISRHG